MPTARSERILSAEVLPEGILEVIGRSMAAPLLPLRQHQVLVSTPYLHLVMLETICLHLCQLLIPSI